MRDALIADIKPLADAGVQFTVSTDAHRLEGMQKFNPEPYCAPLNVTPEEMDEALYIVSEVLTEIS